MCRKTSSGAKLTHASQSKKPKIVFDHNTISIVSLFYPKPITFSWFAGSGRTLMSWTSVSRSAASHCAISRTLPSPCIASLETEFRTKWSRSALHWRVQAKQKRALAKSNRVLGSLTFRISRKHLSNTSISNAKSHKIIVSDEFILIFKSHLSVN